MHDLTLTRRHALLGTAALAGAASVGVKAGSALAKAPMATDQAPYFYRFKHGLMQGTVISDGVLLLGDSSSSFLGISKDEFCKI